MSQLRHCGRTPILEARPVLSRYICPVCGCWQYVNTDNPKQWVEPLNRVVKQGFTTGDHFRDVTKMAQPSLFVEVDKMGEEARV